MTTDIGLTHHPNAVQIRSSVQPASCDPAESRSATPVLPRAVQVDWLGGFADTADLYLESFLTPVLRCLEHRNGRLVCEHFARLASPQIARSLPIKTAARVNASSCYQLTPKLGYIKASEHGKELLSRHHPHEERICEISDEQSHILTFRQIGERRPHIAAIIEKHAPCPDSVSFFINDNANKTVVVPSTSILFACYLPSVEHFMRYATTYPRPQTYFNGDVAFDGLAYRSAREYSSSFFPLRMQRNLARAEFEISQLLPRATAYRRLYKHCLPILIRPPVTGRVKFGGAAIVDQTAASETVVFVGEVDILPPMPRICRADAMKSLLFAPRLSRSNVALTEVRAVADLKGRRGTLHPHDLRSCAIVSSNLERAVLIDALRLSPGFSATDPAGLEALRASCLKGDWIVRA